jgi:RNA polymerase sigma factor (sigma-70 family)
MWTHVFIISDILTGCAHNDARSQKQLYERYYGYALKTVFRYIFKYEKAVDVVNDGFVKLFRHFTQFQANNEDSAERMLMGWIRRIMINNAIDELRRSNAMIESACLPDAVYNDTSASDNADQTLLYKELIEQVGRLPVMYRTVFNMYVIDGLTHNEIAELLGIAVGTSKSNLFKARNLLQTYLKESRTSEICRM